MRCDVCAPSASHGRQRVIDGEHHADQTQRIGAFKERAGGEFHRFRAYTNDLAGQNARLSRALMMVAGHRTQLYRMDVPGLFRVFA
jgi:hypothetical protein